MNSNSLITTAYPRFLAFHIEGVKCVKCIQKLESLPLEHKALLESRFSQKSSSLKLTDQGQESVEQIIEWIEAKGFKATLLASNLEAENLEKLELRSWLTRLVITFAVAGNIMMFAAGIYTGAAGEWKQLFHSLNAILFLAIAGYSALPFYSSAIKAIRTRQFSADLALVIAFIWGSSLSYFNFFKGRDEVFFDSTASFIFLILLTRFFLWKAQKQNSVDLNSDLMFNSARGFLVKQGSQLIRMDYHKIQAEQIYRLEKQQTIPTDGILLSPALAYLNSSFFSGESEALAIHQGQRVRAGQICLSAGIEIQSTSSFEQSEMGKIFSQLKLKLNEKTLSVLAAEKWTKRLLLTVSSLSIFLLIVFGLQGNFAEGFQRALALFTIACPCALSFAIPLAATRSMAQAANAGLLVKSPQFFENLALVKKVIFDKTGTLTQGQIRVADLHWLTKPQDQDLTVLANLVQHSQHPLSQSANQYFSKQTFAKLDLPHILETANLGLDARYLGDSYSIRKADSNSSWEGPSFIFSKNAQPIVEVRLEDELRPEARRVVHILKNLGLKVSIATGDREKVAMKIAKAAGIEDVRAELNPQQKMQLVDNETLIIGDGHNDSLAMSQAKCSLAVGGASSSSLATSQAYSTHVGLASVLLIFKAQDFYHSLVKQNLRLSLGYNIIAGSLAILGLVSPLVAAILMPINSFIVIGATLIRKSQIQSEQQQATQKQLIGVVN